MRIARAGAIVGATIAATALTACGSAPFAGKSPANQPAPAATTAVAIAPRPSQEPPFGAGCAAVPTDASNPGSFTAMAKVPVATAASGNPLLSTLVSAVTKAGLGDSLNTAPDVTVFAPTNDAFKKIPAATLNGLLANNKLLTSTLTYHVIEGRLAPDQLAGTHKTLQGGAITIAGGGTAYTVNRAHIICGNVQTANATVYIIDAVLKPAA
jgi:uncharacterized surface protein with fasciclin (FAS1) repeats